MEARRWKEGRKSRKTYGSEEKRSKGAVSLNPCAMEVLRASVSSKVERRIVAEESAAQILVMLLSSRNSFGRVHRARSRLHRQNISPKVQLAQKYSRLHFQLFVIPS